MTLTLKAWTILLIIAVLMISPVLTHADEFLRRSGSLHSAGIRLYVGEDQKDAMGFHIRDIGYAKESALFVLTSKGARPLKGKLSSINLLNECGDPVPGIGFKKKGYDGFIAAVGKDIDRYVKFFPAPIRSGQSQKSCLTELPKEQMKAVEYASAGLDGIIQQVRWKRNLTQEEIEKQCDSFAKWNVKIESNKSYEDLFKMCMSGLGGHCSNEERVVINLQDSNGKCLEITNSSITCDGESPIGVDLREFLGVLKVEYMSRKEVWLLWNAPSYEGDGIYAVEINDIPKKPRHFEEWLVYNGC
ncbi:MAG: hypothetical protein EPN22_08850 [Nitrospirae bacterium]|nr:MAG: hypothetical protein EPN22_08850 [Nitrospirota bacterium]